MSEKRKAIYYGQVELIPGIVCDGYVLNDNTTVLSERGAADLLGIDHMLLNRMQGDSFPESIKPFIDENFCMEANPLSEVSESFSDKNSIMETNSPPKTPNGLITNGFIMETNLVEVVAENSPYRGREIVVYTAETIETLIFAYAMALAHDALRKNQKHIGKRCVILMRALVRTALEAAIREACGLPLNIQATAQQHVVDIVKMTRDLGLKCSVENDIVTKKDLLDFSGVTAGKLNSHLRKHREHITAIQLDCRQIRATGSRASHMKGFPIIDGIKIILGMDSVPGIELKKQLFGPLGIFATPDTSKEIQWEARLSTAFDGLGFHHNYPFGPYRIDFLIGDYRVGLECNGYEHRYYDNEREKQREELITQDYGLVRFNHDVSLERVINAILRVKPGEIIRLT